MFSYEQFIDGITELWEIERELKWITLQWKKRPIWRRIALSGSHGTWKTTLLDRFQNAYQEYRMECVKANIPFESYGFLTEVARSVIKEIGKNPQDMTNSERIIFQGKILSKQIDKELELSMEKTNVIFDRSIFDILAYTETIEPLTIEDAELKIQIFETAMEFLKKFPYDTIFYFPIEFELEKDGVRFEDLDYQKEVDKAIRKYIDFYKTLKNINTTRIIDLKGWVKERFVDLSIALGFSLKTKEKK